MLGYHVLFWTDLYLEGKDEGFAPPAPFNLDEFDPNFVPPKQVYTKAVLHNYLAHCCAKCVARIGGLDDASASAISGFSWLPCSYFEVQLYNLRHMQEHGAQLNMFLGQMAGTEVKWVKFGAAV
ncbi:MAG: DinB family protein [Anaerolineae bacterium]|nr:DinB family protein [Anaerolineae bacterium]